MDEQKRSFEPYRERLWVPLWWWPIAFAIAGLLAAEIHMGAPGLRAWLPYALLFPVPVWVLLWLSRHRVEVAQDGSGIRELRADRAHLPVNFVARSATVAPPPRVRRWAASSTPPPMSSIGHGWGRWCYLYSTTRTTRRRTG